GAGGGRGLRASKYQTGGELVSLGRYRGVARLPMRIRLRGFPAWWLHRSYHVAMMPTLNRKVRICLDWTVALFFPRDVVALGSLQRPREAFERAAAAEEDGRVGCPELPPRTTPPSSRRASDRPAGTAGRDDERRRATVSRRRRLVPICGRWVRSTTARCRSRSR